MDSRQTPLTTSETIVGLVILVALAVYARSPAAQTLGVFGIRWLLGRADKKQRDLYCPRHRSHLGGQPRLVDCRRGAAVCLFSGGVCRVADGPACALRC